MDASAIRLLIAGIQRDDVLSLNTEDVLDLCRQALRPAPCADCDRHLARVHALERQVAALQTTVETLQAATRQPARADPDLAPILDAVERLRARLYPDPAVPFPRNIKGRALRPAEEILVEDQVYAWAHPADGSRPPSFKAIGERLGISSERAARLYDGATRRHTRVREALGVLADPAHYLPTPAPAATTAGADSEA